MYKRQGSTVSERVVYILFRRSFAMVMPIMKTPSGKVTHHHQPAMPYWYTSVSYTHLDVYKRQRPGLREDTLMAAA